MGNSEHPSKRYGERRVKTANCELCQAPGNRRKLIYHNCGREGHIKRDRMCAARGRKCAKCHVSGHFAACCAEGKGKNKDDTSNNKSFRGQQKRYIRRKQGSTNQVDENGYSSESS